MYPNNVLRRGGSGIKTTQQHLVVLLRFDIIPY